MAERPPTAGEREEDKNKNTLIKPIEDTFSISMVDTCVIREYMTPIIMAAVEAPNSTSTELTSVTVVSSALEPEGGSDGDLENNIDQAHERALQLIIRVLAIVGLLTLIMDVRTVLYKPASGVVFGHNKLAYYITLAVIFTFGVGEVFIAVWISRFSNSKRRCWIGGFVLFLSIWPFVGILSMGGFT
ncbi:hypothetical protein D1007_48599 [Hordeum vulgare]|nr:hypothetical protein D1007_48599 [Hordeum vulgare]